MVKSRCVALAVVYTFLAAPSFFSRRSGFEHAGPAFFDQPIIVPVRVLGFWRA
jgi:hypothetical protein